MKPTRKTIRLIALAVTLITSTSFANAEMLKVGSVKKYVAGAVIGAGTALYMQSTRHIARDLSYHPDKAEPFFEEHPDRFGPVFRYVQRTLSEPISQKDYDRYFKLSELMSKLNIPGFQQTPEPGPTVYDNPIHTPRKDDHRITTPITPTPAGGNIIYTPQGRPIDTTEEYPVEPIRSWQDYILLKSHSQRLSDNMVANGAVREKDTAAHHIIPATHPLAAQARAILERYSHILGSNAFNNAINGAYLPTKSNSRQSGIIHNGRHPDLYVEKVNAMIIAANRTGGLQAVTNTLDNIRQALQNPPIGATWDNIL